MEACQEYDMRALIEAGAAFLDRFMMDLWESETITGDHS